MHHRRASRSFTDFQRFGGDGLAGRLRNVPPPLSEALRAFLKERLSSIEQIEIVLLLMKDRERSWTAPEVAAALGSPQESAAMRLFLLASTGLVYFEGSGVPRYRYAGTDPATEALLAELAATYGENRDAITVAVEGRPVDPLRSFADAFKLKR